MQPECAAEFKGFKITDRLETKHTSMLTHRAAYASAAGTNIPTGKK